jgi:hypothetical protein
MVWSSSFALLLELLPSQQGIAGFIEGSTPSCKDSQVNPT